MTSLGLDGGFRSDQYNLQTKRDAKLARSFRLLLRKLRPDGEMNSRGTGTRMITRSPALEVCLREHLGISFPYNRHDA